jgi:hypothetical protein
MTNAYLIGFVLLVFCFAFGRSYAQENSKTNGQVRLAATLLKSKQKELRYDLEIKNDGSNAVYYSTNPQDVCGNYGPYVSLDKQDSSVEILEWRIFDHDTVLAFDCTVNKTRVELRRLEPDKTVETVVTIHWPRTESAPPVLGQSVPPIERRNVKHLRFSVSYFDEEEGILDVLQHKRQGPYLNGTEFFEKGEFKGKWLSQVQKFASVEVQLPEIRK